MKNTFNGLIIGWAQLRKELLSLRISQQIPQKWKSKGKNDRKKKTRTEYPRPVIQLQKVQHTHRENTRRKTEWNRRNICKHDD